LGHDIRMLSFGSTVACRHRISVFYTIHYKNWAR